MLNHAVVKFAQLSAVSVWLSFGHKTLDINAGEVNEKVADDYIYSVYRSILSHLYHPDYLSSI